MNTQHFEIVLRDANLGDLLLLTHWDNQLHNVEADPGRRLGHKPIWREQLIGELNGRPLGVIQIIEPAKEEHKTPNK